MTATHSSKQSKFAADRWPTEPSLDTMTHPINLDRLPRRPSFGTRALRGLTRFLIIFCIGVAGTLAWQSYGDAAREIVAGASPQLGWLAPQAPAAPAAPAAFAQTVPSTVGQTASATPSPEVQQLTTLSLDLASVRQSVDQLAARQQEVAEAITRLQAAEQDILHKISAPSPQPAAAAARKPVPLTPPPSSQAPPVR
jgi:hypothetical protein